MASLHGMLHKLLSKLKFVNSLIRFRVFGVAIITLITSLGCTLLSNFHLPTLPPTPSMNNVPTGSSPLSGDWQVIADFGRFAFTVDPDGKNVTIVAFKISNWTCCGTTLTTTFLSLSPWSITDGRFDGNVNLNGNFHTMTLIGQSDESKNTVAGTWDQDAHGIICRGEWEAIPRR